MWSRAAAAPARYPDIESLEAFANCAVAGAGAILSLASLRLLGLAKRAPASPLVTVEPEASASGLVAAVTFASSELGRHVCRLLRARGYATVHTFEDGGEKEGWAKTRQGPLHLVVHVAHSAPSADAVRSSTARALAACAQQQVAQLIVISDACVGYDATLDATDGDELMGGGNDVSPHGVSTASGGPPLSARAAALKAAEEAAANFCAAASDRAPAAFVLRAHRVYSALGDGMAGAVLAAACGAWLLAGGARGITNLTHVEDVALCVSLAADKLRSGAVSPGARTLVIADPSVWSVGHLARLAASAWRLPPPVLPLLPLLLLVASPLTLPLRLLGLTPRFLTAATTHCYFTGEAAATELGFAPRAATRGLHSALGAARARATPLVRLVAPLLLLAVAARLDGLAPAHGRPAGEALPQLLLSSATARLAPLGSLDGWTAAGGAQLVCLVACLGCLLRGLTPPPAELAPQPKLRPPVVDGGLPLLGHLVSFLGGPVSMIARLRHRHASRSRSPRDLGEVV